jgi:DNA-binding MarR family transcriptional regulator
MTFEKPNNIDEQLPLSSKSKYKRVRLKKLIIYYLKRIFIYLIFLYVVLTFVFLLQIFNTDYNQEIVEFYLVTSILLFLCYGLLILVNHFLYKSYYDTLIQESKEEIKIVEEVKKEISETLLQGKTLQVYWYIYTHNIAGIREIQKALNMSSSGTVAYQITKLLKAGIIEKTQTEEKYTIKREVEIGILRFFIRIGTKVIPRISLYLIIYILGFIVYSILALIHGEEFITEPYSLLLLLFLIFGTIIFIYESFKIWKLNPTKV